jgi:hypothetical protein
MTAYVLTGYVTDESLWLWLMGETSSPVAAISEDCA